MESIAQLLESEFRDIYAQQEEAETTSAEVLGDEATDDSKADEYAIRVAEIKNKFVVSKKSADELQEYLVAKKAEAEEAEQKSLAQCDAEFTAGWRETGLPTKPSHLQLDAPLMSSARLVNPRAILGRHQSHKGREILQPPRVYEYNDTSIDPHYVKLTATLQNRREAIPGETLQRAKEISLKGRTWHLLSDEELKKRIAESEERRRLQDLKMPATQYDLEKKIIKSMHHKLTFKRNPRHPLPPAVKLLHDQYVEGPAWNVPVKHHQHEASSSDAHHFAIEPEEIKFESYEVSKVCTRKVFIRNISKVIRSLRIIPPASQYFFLSLPRFPTEAGIVAPGMAAELTVRFCPDSLADYEDEFQVDTTGSRFSVKLLAQRPPPNLTLPHSMDVGDVLVGNCKMQQFSFKNIGGQGRFRIIPRSMWPDQYLDAPTDIARVGAFEVWPLHLDLSSGDESMINVSFEPQSMGEHLEHLVIVCDNCQVKQFSISGQACNVDLALDSVDGASFDPALLDAPLWFGNVVPGSGFTRKVGVRNTTSLPFLFMWKQSLFKQQGPEAEEGGGKIDLVELGLENDRTFVVEPDEGSIQPGEVLEFEITFLPSANDKRYERWLRLCVDRTSPGQAPQGCTVPVIQLGLEGLGAPLELDVCPRIVKVPGSLTTGAKASSWVTLRNTSRAPAHFTIKRQGTLAGHASSEAIGIHPPEGLVPPLGELRVTVAFHAVKGAHGPQEHHILCCVDHGEDIPITVRANVELPEVRLITTGLDYGIIPLGGSAILPLVLRNGSSTAFTPWSLSAVAEDGIAHFHQTHVKFEPSSGTLAPGQQIQVMAKVTALSDGPHKTTVMLRGPGDKLAACIEALACVATPRAVISTPKIDLGHTFVGVTVRSTVTVRNLSLLPIDFQFTVESPDPEPLAELKIRPEKGTLQAGDQVEVQLRYAPRSVGHSCIFGVCQVAGAPDATGFMITSNIQGLSTTYELFDPDEYERFKKERKDCAEGRMRRRRDDVDNFKGMSHIVPQTVAKLEAMTLRNAGHNQKSLLANFGQAVPLGETRHMYLVVTNRTPIEASVKTSLDQFGVEDVLRLTDTKSYRPRVEEDAKSRYGSKYTPIMLSDEAERTKPYHSSAGNSMMATRKLQELAGRVLGDKGLAISVTPSVSTIGPWSRLVLQLSCFNDMCGDYFDTLHVKVGQSCSEDIPVRVGVAGTPLVVQKERVMTKGLAGARAWKTSLEFGQLPVGMPIERNFYVFNTGGLEMHLDWKTMKFLGADRDRSLPDNLLDVKIEGADKIRFEDGAWAEGGDAPFNKSHSLHEDMEGAYSLDLVSRAPSMAPISISGKPSLAFGKSGLDSVSEAGFSAAIAGALAAGRPVLEESDNETDDSSPGVQRLTLNLQPHAIETDVEGPFVVEPSSCIIKGGGSAKFTVRFSSHHSEQCAGYLIGTQTVFSPPGPLSLKMWPQGGSGEVGTLLSGTFHPYAGSPPTPLQTLRVDLSATAIASRLEADDQAELDFTCQSIYPASSHDSYKHVLTMSNLNACPLLLKMHTEGAFELISVVPSAPQDPVAYQGVIGAPVQGFGDQTFVPPQESVDVSIRFKPTSTSSSNPHPPPGPPPGITPLQLNSKSSLNALLSDGPVTQQANSGLLSARSMSFRGRRTTNVSSLDPSQATEESRVDYSLKGELVVTYANGDIQRIPLQGQVLHPEIIVKPKELDFGTTHVRSPKTIEITLSNPTLVDASWAVTLPSNSLLGPVTISQDQRSTLSRVSHADQRKTEDSIGHSIGGGKKSQTDASSSNKLVFPTTSSELAASATSEARFGPFIVKPASGLIPGRGLGLPKTQRISLTFSPLSAMSLNAADGDGTKTGPSWQRLEFLVLKGRSCVIDLKGTSSFSEVDETTI